jgi:hypothetical protein
LTALHVTWQVIVAHFVGIYALVMVVGDIVDWIGRTRSAVGACSWHLGELPPVGQDDRAREAAVFGLGLGWNFWFVAATAVLSGAHRALGASVPARIQ